jgi:glycosyltransferase involved in cell wall biosynthesis
VAKLYRRLTVRRTNKVFALCSVRPSSPQALFFAQKMKKNDALKQNKNILYLSYDGMTDPLGQSQVLPYLKGLAREGYRFHLISFEKAERFEKFRSTIQAICDESGIVWHPLTYTKKPPLLSTVYDVQRMKRLAHQLHRKHSFSIVHCRSYISALVGMGMKRKFGTKFLFDMRGFWADERIDGGIWNLSNPVFKTVYNYFKRKEIAFFKEADHVISLTTNGKEEIESWKVFEGNPPKIEVIPCCADLDLFDPNRINATQLEEKRTALNISNSAKILGYVGSIGTWYMLPEMLDCFKVLKEKDASYKFLFVTGENPNSILKIAQEKSIDQQDIIITSCLHKEVPLYISLFDVSVFFIRPSYSKKASSPTKQGEIMAMGVPLICNAGVGDTDKVVQDYKAGVVLNELNEENYRNMPDSTSVFDRDLTMKGARDFYGLEEGVQRYCGIRDDTNK